MLTEISFTRCRSHDPHRLPRSSVHRRGDYQLRRADGAAMTVLDNYIDIHTLLLAVSVLCFTAVAAWLWLVHWGWFRV